MDNMISDSEDINDDSKEPDSKSSFSEVSSFNSKEKDKVSKKDISNK